MKGSVRYISLRFGSSLITLLFVSVVIFTLVRLLPGDPARIIAGVLASQKQVDEIRRQLGLGLPLPVQYGIFLSHLAVGNLGISARSSLPVAVEIAARLPYTLALAVLGSAVGALMGLMAGIISAVRRYSLLDYLSAFVALAGLSMPVYWLGLLLIVLFAVDLHWLPAAGAAQPTSIILPALTLAVFTMALVARMTRATMLEVLRQDYIRTARAKGLHDRTVIYRHVLRNAFIPILTVIGLQFGQLLGGAVLTETVFGWPGMGQLLLNSIYARDYPMVQGIILVYAVLIIVVNFLVDVLYSYIDPRVRYD